MENEVNTYDNEPVEVSSLSDIDFSATYSYAHYLKWVFEDRVELIKGKIFKMTGPNRIHQKYRAPFLMDYIIF